MQRPQTPLGFAEHASEPGLDRWVAEVGVTNAPVPRQGVRTALKFFAAQMPTLSTEMALNFLRAMDLSRKVEAVTLRPGEPLIAFRTDAEINASPFRLFYARPGASMFDSGINHAGRRIVRFKARTAAPALETYTTGAIDIWTVRENAQPTTVVPRKNTTGVMAMGGGAQLVVPNAAAVLELSASPSPPGVGRR